jgi:arsenate reductase
MLKVMFLCIGNSCRSQMAEGFARKLGKGRIEAYSAGLAPVGINPNAITVMKEAGIDISRQSSEPIDMDLLNSMDVIITLCGNAEASCPMTPSQITRIHWPVDDPAGARGTEEEILDTFRTTRDDVRERIKGFVEDMRNEGTPE